ncbi:MAG: hypothetical protein OEX83_05710, partial [Gammaproteobacteria bacterium]|nr:hypothetical protein [Gammaproteobacteria bacterium]
MFGGNDNKQDGKWKQKYYDSLEQFEKQEKQYVEIETALSRGIARLSHSANGINPVLDGYLNSLRKSISANKGIDQTLKVLDEVCQTIDRIGKISSESKNVAVLFSARDAIRLLMSEINLTESESKEVKQLANNINKSADSELKSLTSTLAAIVNKALKKKPKKEHKKESIGLFQRIV